MDALQIGARCPKKPNKGLCDTAHTHGTPQPPANNTINTHKHKHKPCTSTASTSTHFHNQFRIAIQQSNPSSISILAFLYFFLTGMVDGCLYLYSRATGNYLYYLSIFIVSVHCIDMLLYFVYTVTVSYINALTLSKYI